MLSVLPDATGVYNGVIETNLCTLGYERESDIRKEEFYLS